MRTYPNEIKTGTQRANFNLNAVVMANYALYKDSPSTISRQFARSTARVKAKFDAKRNGGIAAAKREGKL